MQDEQWRRGVTIALVVSLLLGLAGLGVGVEALRRDHTHKNASAAVVPATTIAAPATGSAVSGTTGLDATAIAPGVTAVDFVATGGPLHAAKIAKGNKYIIGWVGEWDTTKIPNGVYTITSIGYNATGRSAPSSGVRVEVKNF